MNHVESTPIRTIASCVFLALALVLPTANCAEESSEGGTVEAATSTAQPSAPETAPAAAAPVPAFEEPPVLDAREILDPPFQKGPHFTVQNEVQNDGYMNHFDIVSDYGEYRVGSEALLALRLHEIEAIAALKGISSGEVIVEAAKEGAIGKVTSPIKGAQAGARALTHPTDTAHHLGDVGRGAMRVFGRASRHARGDVEDVADAVTGDKDVAAASRGIADRTGDDARFVGGAYTGYDKAEMELMKELGIDPYTDNQVLLDEVHRVAGLGSAIRVGFKFVPGIPGTNILSMIHKVDKYSDMIAMYQDPGALQAQTRSMALGMGVSPEVYDAFAKNPYYNPAMQNVTVGAIRSMQETKDKGKFLELAAAADDRESALFFMTIAHQLAQVHEDEVTIVQMVAGVRIPAGLARDGRLIVPLPVDHLVWTQEVADVFRDSKKRVREEDKVEATYSEIRIRGTVSDGARAGLEAMDMRVMAGVDA